MKINKIIFMPIIFLVFTAIAGCQPDFSNKNESKYSEKTIFALDTIISLKIYDNISETQLNAAENKITQLESLLSVTSETSDVTNLNQNSGLEVSISEDTLKVLDTANQVSDLTDGALDISVYPLVKLWGFTTSENHVPNQNQINQALQKVDYTKIQFDKNKKTARLGVDTQIDLGAVAKGYISEQLKDFLKQNNIKSAVLSFGGNIQTIGTKNGEPWKIGIKYPLTNESFAVLQEEEIAVVTSATDQRYFEQDGKMYHHIIDPKTGYPVQNGTFSATVICDSGTKADALSTALFVMGIEKAKKLYQNSSDFEFVILDDNNNVYVTSGLKDKFSLTEQYKKLNIIFIEK